MVKEGDKAPKFELEDASGRKWQVPVKGKVNVIYFYPRDNTPGCTTEAQEFKKEMYSFEKEDAMVFGISADSKESHQKFKEKHNLNFPLLADIEQKASRAYGVWARKSMYGKLFWGIKRSTFVVSSDGTVLKVYEKVKPKGHAKDVLTCVSGL